MYCILIVCTGNTCRSPMAEYLLRELLDKQGAADRFIIQSAGLACIPGDSISENALVVLQERGINAAGHRAQPLTVEAVKAADHLYVMTDSHRNMIVSAVPAAAEKISVLGVSDPYGMPLAAYRDCAEQIVSYFTAALPQLLSAADQKEQAE